MGGTGADTESVELYYGVEHEERSQGKVADAGVLYGIDACNKTCLTTQLCGDTLTRVSADRTVIRSPLRQVLGLIVCQMSLLI